MLEAVGCGSIQSGHLWNKIPNKTCEMKGKQKCVCFQFFLKNVTKTDFYYKNILKIKIKSDDKTEWIPVSFPKLIQSSLLPIQIHGQIELNWIRNLTGFQGNNFVCGGWRRDAGGGSVCVLMRFEWKSLSVGGWVSEFWTSGIVCMLILTIDYSHIVLIIAIWPGDRMRRLEHSTVEHGSCDESV